MKIAINMSPMLKGKSVTGIGNYIIHVLMRIMEMDETNQFILISNGPLNIDIPKKETVRSLQISCSSSFLFSRYLILKELYKEKVDVYWSPNQVLPIMKPKYTKYYMTVYDIANLKNVGFARYSFLRQWLFRYTTGHSIRISDSVLSISEATRNDLIEVFHLKDTNKVKTIYLGYDVVDHIGSSSSIVERLQIRKPFLLYVGTLQPRKNIKTIVDGYIRLRENGMDACLVMAGGIGWGMDEVLESIKASPYGVDIYTPGYITEADKKALYMNAACLVFPSLYEGFGLPVLEAFTYGIPVITAKNSSLPEVGGNAALYLNDELSAHELAGLMARVLDLSEDERIDIKEKEQKQLQRFGWDKCASETLAVLTSNI